MVRIPLRALTDIEPAGLVCVYVAIAQPVCVQEPAVAMVIRLGATQK